MNPSAYPYSQTRQFPDFDWNRFLADPDQRTDADWEAAAYRADDWVTCACGSQCAVLPRDEFGCPEDLELTCFGLRFGRAIRVRNVKAARYELDRIEARSAQLLDQMGAHYVAYRLQDLGFDVTIPPETI